MRAIVPVSNRGYAGPMPRQKKPFPRTRRVRRQIEPAQHPNRLFDLATAAGLTYADIADATGSHRITIAKLATGQIALTQEWMERLAPVLGTTPAGLIEAPPAGLRLVKVAGVLQAGAWSETHEWPPDEQFSVMVPDDPALRRLALYGGVVRGDSMDEVYPEGTIVVLTRIADGGRADIRPGRRYHVRITRADGLTEDTLKTLIEKDGKYWLRPESSNPEFKSWIPLDGLPGTMIELIGLVRFAVTRED